MSPEARNHRDYGLTDADFREIVEFFYALLLFVEETERKIEMENQLVRILHGRLQQLITERQKFLRDELSGLELLKAEF